VTACSRARVTPLSLLSRAARERRSLHGSGADCTVTRIVHGAGGAPHAAQEQPRGQEFGPGGAAASLLRTPEGLHARRALPPFAHVAGKRPPLCPPFDVKLRLCAAAACTVSRTESEGRDTLGDADRAGPRRYARKRPLLPM